MIRRLTEDDAELLREAYAWDCNRPLWYRQMDAVFNSGHDNDLIEQLSDWRKVFVGVWEDGQFAAVIIIDWRDDGQFEGHLMSHARVNTETIQTVAWRLLTDLLNFGLQEAFVWVAEKHRSVRKLCDNIGFQPDGIVMYRGTYRGRVIKWLRYSIQREQILMAQAA